MAEYQWPAADKRTSSGSASRAWTARRRRRGARSTRTTFVPDGMLYGKIIRSPHAHAKIVSIDTSAAEKHPGVKAVER